MSIKAKSIPVVFGLLIIVSTGCSNKINKEIDNWNREFNLYEQNCYSGNTASCESACRMVNEKSVCRDAAEYVDSQNQDQVNWLKNCPQMIDAKGVHVCQKAKNGRLEKSIPATGQTDSNIKKIEDLQKEIKDLTQNAAAGNQSIRELEKKIRDKGKDTTKGESQGVAVEKSSKEVKNEQDASKMQARREQDASKMQARSKQDIIVIVIPIIGILILGIIIWLFVRDFKARKEKLRLIAESFGGTCLTRRLLDSYVRLHYNGGTFEIFFTGGKQINTLNIEKEISLGYSFSIYKKKFLHAFSFFFSGSSKYHTGNSTFDDKFYIRHNNAKKMGLVISNKENRRIINQLLFEYNMDGLNANKNSLSINKDNYKSVDLEPNRVKSILDHLSNLNLYAE